MSYVFISHSSKDEPEVRQKIVSLLKDNDIPTWYSVDDIRTLEEWHAKIVAALDNCGWFLVAISPHAIESEWVGSEVHRAFEKKQNRIIPVLLRSCDSGKLHLKLSRIQQVDLTQDLEVGQAKLLEILGRKVPKPITPKDPQSRYLRVTLLILATALVGLMVWYVASTRFKASGAAINSQLQTSAGDNANMTNAKTVHQTTNENTMPTGKLTPRKERINPSDEQSNNQNSNQR